jgi:hypothetical protein
MSLSYRQRQHLRRIEKAMAAADPHLAAMLVIFARLAAGEAMPVWDRISRPLPWPVRSVACAALAVIRLACRAVVACRRAGCHAVLWAVAACPLMPRRIRCAARAHLWAASHSSLHGSATGPETKN